MRYTAWAPDEPNDDDGTENCVQVKVDKDFAKWDDHACSKFTNGFVCETAKGEDIIWYFLIKELTGA